RDFFHFASLVNRAVNVARALIFTAAIALRNDGRACRRNYQCRNRCRERRIQLALSKSSVGAFGANIEMKNVEAIDNCCVWRKTSRNTEKVSSNEWKLYAS